jgi:uncharacterized membrane protein
MSMLRRLCLSKIELAAALLLPAELGTAWLTWWHGLPGLIAVHFGIHGEPNGWADRGEVALILLLTNLYFAMAIAWLGHRRRRSILDAPSRRMGFTAAQLLVLCAGVGVTDTLAGLAGTFGEPWSPIALMTPICLAFIIMGAMIGRVPPNAFVGIRTPWTLSSRLAWDRSNRLLGRLFLLVGCVAFATTFWSSMLVTTLVLAAGGLLAAGWAVLEGWLVWRGDARKTSLYPG